MTVPVARRRLVRLGFLFALLFGLWTHAGQAQPRRKAPPAPQLPAPAAFLDVRWPRGGLLTGRAALLEVSVSPVGAALTSLSGTIGTHRVVVLPASADRRRALVLAPIDVDAKPKPQMLALAATLTDGTVLSFRKPVSIVEAPYETRALSVAQKFVAPNKRDRARAAKENRVLAAVLEAPDAERHWRGSFVRPAPGIETSPFGTKRTYNNKTKSRHMGWDLDGKVGDPIVAAARGRVALSADRFFSGGTVVIDHGQGMFTMYFHMSRRDVVDGQRVERGDLLGGIGATGRVTGPHLHFMVKIDGLSIDPKPFLELNLSSDAEALVMPALPPTDAGVLPSGVLPGAVQPADAGRSVGADAG